MAGSTVVARREPAAGGGGGEEQRADRGEDSRIGGFHRVKQGRKIAR
jgi:hypothetical protein